MDNPMIVATLLQKGGKNMAGVLTPLEHSVHMLNACRLYSADITLTKECIIAFYGNSIYEKAFTAYESQI